jgi:hypothetical protein
VEIGALLERRWTGFGPTSSKGTRRRIQCLDTFLTFIQKALWATDHAIETFKIRLDGFWEEGKETSQNLTPRQKRTEQS